MNTTEAQLIVHRVDRQRNGFRTLRECAELAGYTRETALKAFEVLQATMKMPDPPDNPKIRQRRTKQPESSR